MNPIFVSNNSHRQENPQNVERGYLLEKRNVWKETIIIFRNPSPNKKTV